MKFHNWNITFGFHPAPWSTKPEREYYALIEDGEGEPVDTVYHRTLSELIADLAYLFEDAVATDEIESSLHA